MVRGAPLDSETGMTEELWWKTYFLKKQNKEDSSIFNWQKKVDIFYLVFIEQKQ